MKNFELELIEVEKALSDVYPRFVGYSGNGYLRIDGRVNLKDLELLKNTLEKIAEIENEIKNALEKNRRD